jgi:hypothetical protein
VVFSKPVANLGVRRFAEIPFRSTSVYLGTGLEQQAQLWLYGPKHVYAQLIWTCVFLFSQHAFHAVFVFVACTDTTTVWRPQSE